MNKIKNFDRFNEAWVSKMRRTVTGQSAGDEIQKLPKKVQSKLNDLYFNDSPEEAAKYLRSIIIKEKNSQFGIGLALTIAGASMIYKAYSMEGEKPKPIEDEDEIIPPPPPKPNEEIWRIKYGETVWGKSEELLTKILGRKPNPQEIMEYTKQILTDNAYKFAYTGKYGSPGTNPGDWVDLNLGKLVKGDNIPLHDYIKPGDAFKILPPKFLQTVPQPYYGK
jgi:hypothetical protein